MRKNEKPLSNEPEYTPRVGTIVGEQCNLAKDQAIPVLLSVPTYSQAARILKVDERTVSRWMQDDVFVEKLEKARARIFRDTMSRSKQLLSTALDRLGALMDSPEVQVQLKAINALVSMFNRCSPSTQIAPDTTCPKCALEYHCEQIEKNKEVKNGQGDCSEGEEASTQDCGEDAGEAG